MKKIKVVSKAKTSNKGVAPKSKKSCSNKKGMSYK